MPVIFDEYNLKIANTITDKRQNAAAKINLAFYNGDHWQGAEAYTGPAPQKSDAGYSATMAEIERAFVSRNAIGEITDRHTGGVLGREIRWLFSVGRPLKKDEQPTDEEQAILDEAEQAMTAWWDKQRALGKYQSATTLLLLASRSPLRVYVPPGLRDENGEIPKVELNQATDYIWFQSLGVNEDTLELQQPSATVYTDKATKRQIGVFSYKKAPDMPDGKEGENLAELCYLDEEGGTVLRIVNADGDVEEPVTLPLGGRLTIYEMVRRPLVGSQIVSQQKLLNLAETMLQRNVVLGGFLERVFFNAQSPGYEVTNDDGSKSFVPNPLYVGAGTTNFIQGIKYPDADGNEQITTPSAVYRDPVPVTTFTETSHSAYLAILEEAQQLHYAMAGDAAVSAVSRIQARDAFEKDLQITAAEVEAAVRWLLETVLAMAAHFAGQSERYAGLRAVVQARIDSGPVSAEEKQTAAEMKDRGLWSWEYAASVSGIEDTDAERERIEKEGIEQQALGLSEVDKAKIYREYKTAGVPPPTAAKRAGWSEEEAKALEKAIDEQANKEDESATAAAADRLRNLPTTVPVAPNGQPVGGQQR